MPTFKVPTISSILWNKVQQDLLFQPYPVHDDEIQEYVTGNRVPESRPAWTFYLKRQWWEKRKHVRFVRVAIFTVPNTPEWDHLKVEAKKNANECIENAEYCIYRFDTFE